MPETNSKFPESRLVVDASFRALFPDARIGVVAARGIDNTANAEECARLLSGSGAFAAERLRSAGELAAHPAIAKWRAAYKLFGAPKGTRSSIEALLRRTASGKGVPSINPLVDLYNAVSLEAFVPCGGEDLCAIRGDLRLLRASGGEHFVPLGEAELSPPMPGEVIYRDDDGVVCRAWNWREAERTKLTQETRDAVLCIECVDAAEADAVERATKRLAELVERLLGGTTRSALLGPGVDSFVL